MVARLLATIFLGFVVLSPAEAVLAQSTYQSLMINQNSASRALGGATTVDLVIESDTYVPYFYQGRREPTAGSRLRLIALSEAAGQTSSYRWQVANQYFTTASPVFETTVPETTGEFPITVQLLSRDGSQLGTATNYLRPSRPKVLFYQNNELRGVSSVALGKSLPLIGQEVAVRAEPYFLGVSSLLNGATGSWSADPALSLVVDGDWRKATLVRNETDPILPEAAVSLKVTNINNPADTLSGTFKLGL